MKEKNTYVHSIEQRCISKGTVLLAAALYNPVKQNTVPSKPQQHSLSFYNTEEKIGSGIIEKG